MPVVAHIWTREEILLVLDKDISRLRVQYSGEIWLPELIAFICALQRLLSEPEPDKKRLLDLQSRFAEFASANLLLTAMCGYLRMIDCVAGSNNAFKFK